MAQICLKSTEWALAEEECNVLNCSAPRKVQQIHKTEIPMYFSLLSHSLKVSFQFNISKKSEYGKEHGGFFKVHLTEHSFCWWQLGIRAVRSNGWWDNRFLKGSRGNRVHAEMDDGKTQCELEDQPKWHHALECTEELLSHWGTTGLSQLAVLARTGTNCSLAVSKMGEVNWNKWKDCKQNAMHLYQTYLFSRQPKHPHKVREDTIVRDLNKLMHNKWHHIKICWLVNAAWHVKCYKVIILCFPNKFISTLLYMFASSWTEVIWCYGLPSYQLIVNKTHLQMHKQQPVEDLSLPPFYMLGNYVRSPQLNWNTQLVTPMGQRVHFFFFVIFSFLAYLLASWLLLEEALIVHHNWLCQQRQEPCLVCTIAAVPCTCKGWKAIQIRQQTSELDAVFPFLKTN